MCMPYMYTSRLGDLKYEYPFLGRRHTSRKLLYLGPMGQYWSLYGCYNIYIYISSYHHLNEFKLDYKHLNDQLCKVFAST